MRRLTGETGQSEYWFQCWLAIGQSIGLSPSPELMNEYYFDELRYDGRIQRPAFLESDRVRRSMRMSWNNRPAFPAQFSGGVAARAEFVLPLEIYFTKIQKRLAMRWEHMVN